MSSEDLDSLHDIWVKFLNTKNTDEGENWLDAFLARYLTLFCYNEIPSDHDFSFQYKLSANVLVHQMLTDVYQICEDVKKNSPSLESENEISAIFFRKYLLEGRGWKILWTLDKIGVQHLIHLKELILLLISQMPVVLSLPVQPSIIPECLERKPKHLDINSCFYTNSRQIMSKGVDLRKPEMYLPLKRIFQGKKRIRRKKVKPEQKSSSSSSEGDVIFESCYIPASQLKSLMKAKRGTNEASSDSSESIHEYIGSDTSIASNVNDFETYSVCVVDYIGFILNLFQESVTADIKVKDIKDCTSLPILEFALRTLKDIHLNMYSFAGWSEDAIDDLRNRILDLLFFASTVTRVSFGYNEAPNANEIITTLFLIAEEIINMPSLGGKNIKYASHILKGALMLIHNVIEVSNNDYAKVICIIRTFSASGANLCCSIFSLLDRQITNETENEVRIIISLVKDIIIVLKILRTSATYDVDDPWDVQDYIHHHNDILGPLVSHSIINKDPMCCVAAMSLLFFKMFGVSLCPRTSNEILKSFKLCGICCCINPSFILKILFDGYGSRDPETQKLVLVILGKHLLPQLGLTSVCQRRCSYCSKYLTASEILTFDKVSDCSILENKDWLLHPNPETGDSYLLICNVYNDLLNLTVDETLENVAKHLIELFSVCISEFKTQLFLRVILPQFLHLRNTLTEPLVSSVSVKIKCFLTVLPYILSNNTLYSIFVKFKGIPIIFPFLLNAEFRELALNVIKILIFSENETRAIDLIGNTAVGHFPASRTFCTFLFEHSEVFFHKFNLVLKLSQQFAELLVNNKSVSPISGSSVTKETFTVIEEFPENITFICDIWNSFKELVLNVKLNSLNVVSDGVLTSGYNLLILLLKNLSIILKVEAVVKNDKIELILQLVQNLISILLNMKKELQHKKSILEIMKYCLKTHASKCGEHQKMLFKIILKCCFWPVPVSAPVTLLQKNVFINTDMHSASSSDNNQAELSSYDSYAGDTEGSCGSKTVEVQKEGFICENFIEHGEFIKMLCELILDLQAENSSEWISTALYLIQILTNVCQDCGLNKSVLSSHDIPPLLLDIFANSLKSSGQKNLREFQSVTMELFVLLTESSMKVYYIRKIVDFFKELHAPFDILLTSLNNMISCMVQHATWYTSFPCIQKSSTNYLKVKGRLRGVNNTSQQYKSVGDVPSAWTSAALSFPLTEDTKWNSINKGFSFLLWLKMNHSNHICRSASHSMGNSSAFRIDSNLPIDSSHVSPLLHIISLGYEKLLIEFWCGKFNAELVIRISSYVNGTVTCLSEGTCTHLFQHNKWHHIAISYSEDTEKSLYISKFQVVIDGIKEKNIILKYKRSGIKSPNKCYLLLGHSIPVVEATVATPSYSLASFSLFKDVLTTDVIYYLSSLGPDRSSITNCAIQRLRTFPPRNNSFQNFVSSSNFDVIMRYKVPSLDMLQNSLICFYAAENPITYLVYPATPRGFFPLRFTVAGRLSSFEDWPYQKQPLEFAGLSLAVIHSHEHHGFEYAVQRSGGIRIFLFLFANVLEFSASEENISAALNIILQLLNKNTAFVEDFIRIKGYELLTQMITNAKCCISSDFLQVFIQNCMMYTIPDKEFLRQTSEAVSMAIITNPSIFSLMVKSLAFARHVPQPVVTGLFSVLDLLLSPKHSSLNINVEQLNSVQTLNGLIWLLKRNYIISDDNYLPSAVTKMIPIIIEKLLTYKFDVVVLQTIIRMLLLLHSASSTYVCHSPSAFYFLTLQDNTKSVKVASVPQASAKVSFADEADDSFVASFASKRRRSSSFSGIASQKERYESMKSKSVENIPVEVPSSSEHGGVSDSFDIDGPDSRDFMRSFRHITDPSFGAEFKINKCTILISGLLKLIYNFITSNSVNSQALLAVIKPEIFIVLAYTDDTENCASVIRVIDAYLKATSEEKRHEFLSMKGFHLLANQLYQSAADPEIIDACFSIIFDCPLSVVKVSDITEKNVSSFQILSWVPVLALLPNTYSDEAISKNILVILKKFLCLGTVIVMELLENGLCMSLINLIMKLCASSNLEPDEEMFLKYPCMLEINYILRYIARDLCSSRGSKSFVLFYETLQLFAAWERKCEEKYGAESVYVTTLRSCQCILYEVIVEFYEICSLPKHNEHRRFNDEASLWELVVELQGTYGSFSSISVPDTNKSQAEVQKAVEAEELDQPSRLDTEKSVNDIPMNDIVDRLLILIESAADFFIFKDYNTKISASEKRFFRIFFDFVIQGISISLDKNFKPAKAKVSSILLSLKDILRKQLSRLLLSSFSPPQDIYIKKQAAEILSLHPSVYKILQLMVFSVLKIRNFLIFLYDLHAGPPSDLQRRCTVLFTVMRHLLQNTTYLNVLHSKLSMNKNKEEWLKLWKEDRRKWLTLCEKSNEKMIQKMEFLAQDVSTMALYVTQQVFEIQNSERKILIEELKIKYYEEASERMKWLELCEQMTHERAIWYMKDYYPFIWETDPTEGPSRVRRRLKRCHVHLSPKFFMPDVADALINLKKETPFVDLLVHQNELPDSAVVLDRLFSNEQIKFTCPCKIVTAFEEFFVEILIGAYCIHIIGEGVSTYTGKRTISESWAFEFIKEIVPRRHELQNNSFEIFLTNGVTYMIAFGSEKDFSTVWKQLEDLGLPCENNKDPSALTQLWRDGTLTNFEYLIHLNKLSGRTYNDLMQYPVFPFILADYVSYFLNLDDPDSFRNLTKPIAVQNPEKEEHYLKTYRSLSNQAEFDDNIPYVGPYHYGSLYSNSGTVLHFLIRLLPYTYGFVTYQDSHFDCADRTFHNVASSWDLVTVKSSSDVKELIPEFFFFPEFLCNRNGYDFGITQNGIRVNDVILPPWCKQNARLFILIHRQALESKYVTNSLHGWIDLIFGYKQTGEAAVNAINCFHPSTYYGVDRNKYEKNQIQKNAFKTMVRTLGNTPQQLFFSPHPMVSLALAGLEAIDEFANQMEVIDTVQGLRWGNYVGSPATGIPCLVWCRKQSVILGSFLPLLTNYVFALGENVCLLLNHRRDTGSGISRATYIMSAALVSWGHRDGIVRIKLCRDQPTLPLLRGTNVDPICLCASVPDCEHLFVAHKSGIINAYTLELNASDLAIKEKKSRVQLNGHSDEITSIYISKAFSIFASASLDQTVIIWDLNRLCYVRSLVDYEGAVTLVHVSDTLGDIASVNNVKNSTGSHLSVHTINGDLVGRVHVFETITAICYSTAPEGSSVNVIATGLDNGTIRLWSSWDLKLVREILCDRFTLPVRCLTFSADNQHFYASNEDGTVIVWEKPSRGLTSVPRLLIFT